MKIKPTHILVLFLLLTSCSIEHHLSKAQKHIDIAKRKGAVITPDTVWHYQYNKEYVFDTLTNTYKEVLKKDSTIHTVNNTINPGMSRQERKALESYYKHLEKMMKLGNDSLQRQLNALIKINKQNKKKERVIVKKENKSPWAWVAALFILLVIIIILKYGSRFK